MQLIEEPTYDKGNVLDLAAMNDPEKIIGLKTKKIADSYFVINFTDNLYCCCLEIKSGREILKQSCKA